MKVLVTGAGALLGQGILRSLLKGSLKPTLVAVDPSPHSAGLYWTDHRYLVPLATSPDYLPRLRSIIERERPDAVLVGTDVELEVLARHRAEIEQTFRTHVLVSSPEVVAIADDKYLTFKFMREHGFDAPESCLPGEERALVERIGFPLIVKPRVGARSIGVRKVANLSELAAAIASTVNPVIQECVATDADEFTAGALYFDGACRASIVMRRELRDGNTYRAFVGEYPEANAIVRAMTEKLRPHGPVNFQYRLDRANRVKVFEINGRFSGTTPLRMHAGFNEVEMCLRALLLGEQITQPAVRPMTILRHWSETVVPEGATVPS